MSSIPKYPIKIKQTELEKHFSEYLLECEFSKRLRPQTLKSYAEVFQTFQKIMPEIIAIEQLCPSMMSEFFRRLQIRKRIVGKDTEIIGVKLSTVRTYYNKLIAFFRWLEKREVIPYNSFSSKISKPPLPRYEDEKALSEEEISKIIASITLHGRDDEFRYNRDLLIISLLLYTGIRKGELLHLRIQDVDFEKQTLFISGKTSKSKRSRSIPLHFSLLSHLKSYLMQPRLKNSKSGALILSSLSDSPLTPDGLRYWVSKYKKKSGINFHMHRFRHTFACMLAKTNADITSIMKVLGHTTTRMTMQYLRSIQAEDAKGAIERLCY